MLQEGRGAHLRSKWAVGGLLQTETPRCCSGAAAQGALWVRGFGLRVLGLGLRVSGLGFRV